jgi:hypothetical protein
MENVSVALENKIRDRCDNALAVRAANQQDARGFH